MPCYFYIFTSLYTLYTSLYIFLYKRDMSRDIGRGAGRDTGRVTTEAGGGGEGEVVKRGGLGRKVGLGKQCLSFDILFLAAPFLLLFPSSTSYYLLFLF